MIQQARKNFPEIRFEIGDATTFTMDTLVNGVFSNATLHWVRPPEAAVERIWTVLTPGGRFVAEFGGLGNVERISGALRVALRSVGGIEFDSISPWYYPSIAEYAGILERQGFHVTFAQLFPRPTPLEGGEQGMRNWLKMFGASLLSHIAPERHDAVLTAAENHARPDLFRDGQWTADYVRLRIVAERGMT
jgi:trans-aconitate 2-methyltransferase